MSTTDDTASYKKLPISKLKSLLSANGVIIPHVKDQPKEYYIKLYEDHILKESVKSTESDEIDDRSESESSNSAAEEPVVTEPQYIYQQTLNKVSATHINTHSNNKHDDTRLAVSNLRWKVFYLIPLLLAILVSLGMMCTVRDTYSNTAVCHSVLRVMHVLSLGLYEHNSGAADY